MGQWFKMHEGTIEKTSLAFIAKRLGVPRTAVQATWWLVLEMASASDMRGAFQPDNQQIELMAFTLDEDIQDVENILSEFNSRGMVRDGIIVDWVTDQAISTAGAARTEKWRKRHKTLSHSAESDAESITCDAQNVTCDENPLRREEKRREEESPYTPQGGSEGDFGFSEFWEARPGRGKAPDSEQSARREFKIIIEVGTYDAASLIRAMRAYAAWCGAAGKAGTKDAKTAEKFLSDGTFEQYTKIEMSPSAYGGEDLPEWQRLLCRLIDPIKVRSFFDGAKFDGKTITCPNEFNANWIKANFDQAIRSALGAVTISLEKRA